MKDFFRDCFIRTNTSYGHLFVYHLGKRGFFAEITTVIRAAVYAHSNQLQLVLDNSEFGFKSRYGWNDYFEPFCIDYNETMEPQVVQHCRSIVTTRQGEFMRNLRAFDPERLTLGPFSIEGMVHILRFFMQILCVPKLMIAEYAAQMMEEHQIGPEYTAIHIRRGDKVGAEDDFYPAPYYLQPLEEKGLLDLPLFVMSDDFESIEEVRRVLMYKNKETRIISICDTSDKGFSQDNLREGRPPLSGPVKESANEKNIGRNIYEDARLLLAQVIISTRSKKFVGTFKSNISWSVRALHENPDDCVLFKKNLLNNQPGNEGRPARVFIIGFPKCGTTALHHLFNKLGYKSCHWSLENWQMVGNLIYKAYLENKPLLTYLNEYDAFTQMDVTYPGEISYWPQLELFRLLDMQYPGSRFILNVRNIDDQIRSITNWFDYIDRIRSAEIYQLPRGKGTDEELKTWIQKHYNNVESYFRGKENYLKFDIDNAELHTLGQFLGVDPACLEWKKINVSHINKARRPDSPVLDVFERIERIKHPKWKEVPYRAMFVSIKDNRIAYCDEAKQWNTRHRVIYHLLTDLLNSHEIPDCDVIFNTDSECYIDYDFPVMAYTKRKSDPRKLYLNPIETIDRGMERKLQNLYKSAKLRDWQSRKQNIYFAGQNSNPVRELMSKSKKFDIFLNPNPRYPFEKHHEYRYTLVMDGNGTAFRIPESFVTGSCVILLEKKEDGFLMDFSPFFQPGEHYILVEYDFDDSMKAIEERIQQAIESHDGESIAKNGKKHALEVFSYKSTLRIFADSLCAIAADMTSVHYHYDVTLYTGVMNASQETCKHWRYHKVEEISH